MKEKNENGKGKNKKKRIGSEKSKSLAAKSFELASSEKKVAVKRT